MLRWAKKEKIQQNERKMEVILKCLILKGYLYSFWEKDLKKCLIKLKRGITLQIFILGLSAFMKFHFL
jgi:hypothetical protein